MILPERALKLLRLAMCDSSHKGERASAAIKFVEELKREGITPEQFERKPPGKGFEHATRYKPAKGPLRHHAPPPAHTATPASQDAFTANSEQRTGRYGFNTKVKHKGVALADQPNEWLWFVKDMEFGFTPAFKAALLKEMQDRNLL